MQGVWLPIITPFKNGEVDYNSYQQLIEYYIQKRITGIIPLGTTGECPVIEKDEFEKIIETTIEIVNKRIPVFIGLGGNFTKKVIKEIKLLDKYDINGILSVCPYYNRPGQAGIYEHFKSISESTSLKICIYNIPYRTGVNIENKYLLKLAELKNIIAVKDSCGNMSQSIELLNNKPKDFYVLTGEDNFFYTNLIHGGDGGIMASAHLNTEKYIEIYNLIRDNNYQKALSIWKNISLIIPLLFKESNPAPLKYCLKRSGLIISDEVRLPLTKISDNLKKELDNIINVN